MRVCIEGQRREMNVCGLARRAGGGNTLSMGVPDSVTNNHCEWTVDGGSDSRERHLDIAELL